MIVIYGVRLKMIMSQGVFFSCLKFWFPGLSGLTQDMSVPLGISGTGYHMIAIFGTLAANDDIFSKFIIFSKFLFFEFLEG